MTDKRELFRYSFKMASDEEAKIMDLRRRIQDIEGERQSLLALIQMKQVRAKRLTQYQDQSGKSVLCPECWGSYAIREPLALGADGIYSCRKCSFVFAAQDGSST